VNVREFVSETLGQIFQGVRDAGAVAKETGGAVISVEYNKEGDRSKSRDGRPVIDVAFDVALTVETTGGGKGNITVFGVGVEAGAGRQDTTVSRVQFSVPIVMPASEPAAEKSTVAAISARVPRVQSIMDKQF